MKLYKIIITLYNYYYVQITHTHARSILRVNRIVFVQVIIIMRLKTQPGVTMVVLSHHFFTHVVGNKLSIETGIMSYKPQI